MLMFLAPAEGELDLGAYLPDLNMLLGNLDLLLRVLVMAGPLCLFGFGLFYFLFPPKEANYTAGYRFRYGMSRVETWLFMQWVAGMVYGALGLGMTVAMGAICTGFAGMAPADMVWKAIGCLIWEIVLVMLAGVVINTIVIFTYDHKGIRRSVKRKQRALEREAEYEEYEDDEE